MEHTQLTKGSYIRFASVILMLGFVTAGVGAVDLAMIAPKGIEHVAAVGQGDLVVVGIYAFFLGIVETFSSRLAIAEGEATTARRLPVLAAALLMLLVLCQLTAFLVAAGIEPVLAVVGQNRELIPLVGDYVRLRLYGVAPVIVYWSLNEALKICGAKNLSIVVLGAGFGLNALLDWLFLYTRVAGQFSSPESAVATATVLAQVLMAGCGGWMFAVRMRARGERFLRPDGAAVRKEFRSVARTAPGVGARHVNDYAGTIVPVMFIGTMGIDVLAAALVATKIYTLFCRVPQACFEATFVFYGYALGRDESDLPATVRKLETYAAIPTGAATLAVLITSGWLVAVFASKGLDQRMAQVLLMAYILYVPAYFFEQFMGRMLTIHQRGAILFTSSTLLTYALTIPLAWYSVFVLHSPFLAIAGKGISTAMLAAIYWYTFRKQCRVGIEVCFA